MTDKKQLCVNVSRDTLDLFKRRYPRCTAPFVERAMRYVLSDAKRFDLIFFGEVLPQHLLVGDK